MCRQLRYIFNLNNYFQPITHPVSSANYQKLINGYYPSQEIRYTKVNELKYEFRIPKDPSFNYSLAFSIQIGKI